MTLSCSSENQTSVEHRRHKYFEGRAAIIVSLTVTSGLEQSFVREVGVIESGSKTPKQNDGLRECSCEIPRTSTMLYKTLPLSKKYGSNRETCAPRTSVSSQAGHVSKEDVPETTTMGPKCEKKSPVCGADAPDPLSK